MLFMNTFFRLSEKRKASKREGRGEWSSEGEHGIEKREEGKKCERDRARWTTGGTGVRRRGERRLERVFDATTSEREV